MQSKKNMNRCLVLVALWLLYGTSAPLWAVTLYDQVLECKNQLQVAKLTPSGSCFGDNTMSIPATKTRLGHFRLNDSTDAVFHCDSVDEDNSQLTRGSHIELIIHNRRSGGTCFFVSDSNTPDPEFPSLDACKSANCSAANFWRRADMNNGSTEDCVFCHQNGGPYFIRESAEAMAHFGLMNDGHSTDNTIYYSVNADAELAATENDMIARSRNLGGTECGLSCHQLGIPTRFTGLGAAVINSRLDQIEGMVDEGSMPPDDRYSPFRWVNIDTPNASGDYEHYSGVKRQYPDLATCETPELMEAHVVGSSKIVRTAGIPFGRLKEFNAVDGLVCLHDYPAGSSRCRDYQVRFKCSNGVWTDWQNKDTPDSDGDREKPPQGCNATQIEAKTLVAGNRVEVKAYGLPDRMYQFNNEGLSCRNADQPDGKCENYVVRFICPQ